MASKNKLKYSYVDGSPLLTRPLFIAFEGKDGSGKDRQLIETLSLLINDENGFLGTKYSPVWRTREPTKLTYSGNKIANAIRKGDVDPLMAAKLFIGDRISHSQKYVSLMLDHSFVLSSRQDLSTLAYQMTQGLLLDDLLEMHNYGAKGTLIPDITLYFDVTVDEAIRRTAKRDGIEECFEKRSFQDKLSAAYDTVIKTLETYQPNRYIIRINGMQPIEDVTLEVANKISSVVKSNPDFFKPKIN